MEPVRVGVIGCGVIGTGAHLPAAAKSELVELAAVADTVEERATAAGEKFGAGAVYTSAEALIQDDRVEAVVLAMPTFVRTGLALQALAAGKHVLTEKPIAMNAGEVEQLIAARGSLSMGCCSWRYRTQPSAKAATECVAAGTLGDLRVVRSRALTAARQAPTQPPPPWRVSRAMNGGGILVNWGCYDLDYILGLTGWKLRPTRVLAQAWPVSQRLASRVAPGSDAETHYAALIRCEAGAVISFERGEFMPTETDEAWQILGENGALRLRMHGGKDKKIYLDEVDPEQGLVTRVLWEGDDTADTNRLLLEDFAVAIREGRQPETSLERALVVQKITDAIYASAASGNEVVID